MAVLSFYETICLWCGVLGGIDAFRVESRLIYYSSEVKQYIVDVAVTIGLLPSPCHCLTGLSKAFANLAFAGSLALWFSHPSLFVLAGIGFAFSFHIFRSAICRI